jgi:hypothetical protein
VTNPDEPQTPTVESLPAIDEANPDVDAVLAHLSTETGVFPHAAVRAAIALREEITPRLLAILEEEPRSVIANENYLAHSFALYLLAQLREPRAYPIVAKLLAVPPETVDDLFGEIVTEGADRILASVSGGDMEPMKGLVENPDAHEYVRSAALDAMLCLVAAGLRTRDDVVAYFRELFDGRLERKPEHIWSALVAASTDLYPEEVSEQIARAYEDELVDPLYIDVRHVVARLETGSTDDVPALLARRGHGLVEDVAREMAHWSWFERDRSLHQPSVADLLGDKPGRQRADRKTKIKRKAQKASRKKHRR